MQLKKKSVLLFFILIFSVSFSFLNFAVACDNNTYKTNYAEWKFSNDQPYLYVEANNYYSLGYLEGQNLAFQTAWMKLMIMLQAQEIGLSYDVAIFYALDYLDYFPEEYLLEMNGFADAINFVLIPFMGVVYNITIDFLDVLAQNCFWDIYYGKIVPMMSGYPQLPLIVAGCTAIGSKIARGRTILGQSIDISLLMQPTASWVYTKIQDKKVLSPLSRRMRVTPWVARSRMETPLRGSLITFPNAEIRRTSWKPDLMIRASITSPVLLVTLAVRIPDPPRFCRR